MVNPGFSMRTGHALDALPIAENVTIALAAGAANSFNATITVKDKEGVAVPGIHTLDVWISDDADGSGLTATAASGALTASTGVILTALTAKKHVRLTTAATGIAVLNLVDSVKTQGERVVVTNPGTSRPVVSAATVTATYG